MTIDDIKKIDITNWMNQHGYKQGRGNNGKWRSFYSPFNSESNPSFKVDVSKNMWLDFSAGVTRKQSIIDLVMRIENCSFSRACNILSGDNEVNNIVYTPVKKEADGVKIHLVEELTDSELLDYSCGVRKINKQVAIKYLKELTISFPYSDVPKTYKGLGFKSDLGGYEFRNSWMRVCAGSKSYTTIKGLSKDKCIITEGFFDALSYLTYYNTLVPEYTMYCLNGATQFDGLSVFIGDKPVLYYGDNDRNGDLIASKITNLEDKRLIYGFHKDFNDFVQDS